MRRRACYAALWLKDALQACTREGDPRAQLETMSDLLRTVRERRVSLFGQGVLLRHIAEAHLALDHLEEAHRVPAIERTTALAAGTR